MPGLLGQQQRPGLLGGPMIRQISMPQGMPQQASPMMMQGQGDGYGSDAWALNTGGPGALLARQLMRGMMQAKNPAAVLDPKYLAKFMSPDTSGLLGQPYQDAYKKANK